jgi:hypothetical protein
MKAPLKNEGQFKSLLTPYFGFFFSLQPQVLHILNPLLSRFFYDLNCSLYLECFTAANRIPSS